MTFDNSPVPPSTRSKVHSLSVLLACVGVMILFVSLHVGATLLIIAGAHLAVIGVVGIVRTMKDVDPDTRSQR